jgi:MFS family permease
LFPILFAGSSVHDLVLMCGEFMALTIPRKEHKHFGLHTLKTSWTNWFSIAFRSLQYRNFRLFFMGQGLSLIGTWFQRIAMPWLVYNTTGSVLLLGIVSFLSQLPTFLIAPFAGVLTDRWNRYTMLIVTQVVAMVQALALAVLYFTHTIEIWHIIALGILLGTVNAFDMPVRQTFMIEMIGERKDLGNAIALNSSMVNSARLIGPSIAGILIAATNEGVCFLVNAFSFVFVIVSLFLMRFDNQNERRVRTNVLKGLKEGSRYVFGFAPIRGIILMIALASLLGMPFTVLIPAYAKEVLHGASHTFGFLMGAVGVGALCAALYLASREQMLKLGKITPLSALIFGFGLILFSFSRSFYLSLVFIAVAGFGMILQLASSNTILQTIVEDDKRGRVMSFYTMALMGTAPFGSLLAGKMASMIGTPHTLLMAGIIIISGTLAFASRLPRLKKMVQPIYEKMKDGSG